jgi:hypothetical protein
MGTYEQQRGQSSIERRARKPTKGLRCKLRMAIKRSGVTTKFSTDELRDGTLLVKSKELFHIPFSYFDGRKVIYILLQNNYDHTPTTEQ